MDNINLCEELRDCWNQVQPYWNDDISNDFDAVVMQKLKNDANEHQAKVFWLKKRASNTVYELQKLKDQANQFVDLHNQTGALLTTVLKSTGGELCQVQYSILHK